MRDLQPPFQFDLNSIIKKFRRHLNKRVTGSSINLGIFSFNIAPDDCEKNIAREIVIRFADRRVLNRNECCDDCIKDSLSSLHKIREFLVDKQVELMNYSDGVLYFYCEFMLEAIRQFFTFEEKIRPENRKIFLEMDNDIYFDSKSLYFSTLEMLRQHLYRCLIQVSNIAEIEIPKIRDHIRYDENWQIEAYADASYWLENG